MKVRYIGAHCDGVEVDALGGVHVDLGDVIDAPDEIAAALLDQSCNWERVDEKPTKTTKPTVSEEE
jgi:hypothetical protein